MVGFNLITGFSGLLFGLTSTLAAFKISLIFSPLYTAYISVSWVICWSWLVVTSSIGLLFFKYNLISSSGCPLKLDNTFLIWPDWEYSSVYIINKSFKWYTLTDIGKGPNSWGTKSGIIILGSSFGLSSPFFPFFICFYLMS